MDKTEDKKLSENETKDAGAIDDTPEGETLDSFVEEPAELTKGNPIPELVPVVDAVPQDIETGVKKVKVKFLKDLYPRVKIGNDWIQGKTGDVRVLTSMQARILRSDNTVT